MKIRSGYVSNSSSSSYVILNWKNLPNEKKKMILEYWRYAYDVWKSLRIDLNYNFYAESIGVSGMNDDEMKSKFNDDLRFGSIETYPRWMFREDKESGVLDMFTIMENFCMDKWMKYIGGIQFRHCGEYAAFDVEEYSIDIESLRNFIRAEIEKEKMR